jgi:hypothetical protein
MDGINTFFVQARVTSNSLMDSVQKEKIVIEFGGVKISVRW